MFADHFPLLTSSLAQHMAKMTTIRCFTTMVGLFPGLLLHAQCDRWQQRIRCEMAVDLDVKTHRFTGSEKLVYQNNSPDTLRQ